MPVMRYLRSGRGSYWKNSLPVPGRCDSLRRCPEVGRSVRFSHTGRILVWDAGGTGLRLALTREDWLRCPRRGAGDTVDLGRSIDYAR